MVKFNHFVHVIHIMGNHLFVSSFPNLAGIKIQKQNKSFFNEHNSDRTWVVNIEPVKL